jgi:DNA/RNA-binding protein KIN17
MNATRWVSLSEFVKHLGREGIAHVDEVDNEGEHGWYLTWIDRSPAALSRQDALQKMERAKVDEEGRMRKYLKEQIEKAKEIEQARQVNGDEATKKVEEGLQRGGDAKPLKIGLSRSSDPTSTRQETLPKTTSSISSTAASAPFKLSSNPFKVKAAAPVKEASKLGGAFKSAAPSIASLPVSASSSRNTSMTAAEKIMAEEQERRDKRKLMGPQPSVKRMRM